MSEEGGGMQVGVYICHSCGMQRDGRCAQVVSYSV